MYLKDKIKIDINHLKKEKELLMQDCSKIFKNYYDEKDYLIEMINNTINILTNEFSNLKNSMLTINDKVWTHKTSNKNKDSIIKNGFIIPKEKGRFGRGIYGSFTDDYSFHGESTINFTIKGNILSLWHDEIIKLFPNEDLEIDETGTYLLEEYAKNLNYDAVEIKYYTEVPEIVIYNTNVIHII